MVWSTRGSKNPQENVCDNGRLRRRVRLNFRFFGIKVSLWKGKRQQACNDAQWGTPTRQPCVLSAPLSPANEMTPELRNTQALWVVVCGIPSGLVARGGCEPVKMLLFRHRNPRLHLLSYTRRSIFTSANEVASEAKKSGHTSKLYHYCSYNMPSFLKN